MWVLRNQHVCIWLVVSCDNYRNISNLLKIQAMRTEGEVDLQLFAFLAWVLGLSLLPLHPTRAKFFCIRRLEGRLDLGTGLDVVTKRKHNLELYYL
jgi:hypothetical protein